MCYFALRMPRTDNLRYSYGNFDPVGHVRQSPPSRTIFLFLFLFFLSLSALCSREITFTPFLPSPLT